jgi:hypothetical protein
MISVMYYFNSRIGNERFAENIKDMIGHYPGKFWKLSWLIFTPLLCVVNTY